MLENLLNLDFQKYELQQPNWTVFINCPFLNIQPCMHQMKLGPLLNINSLKRKLIN